MALDKNQWLGIGLLSGFVLLSKKYIDSKNNSSTSALEPFYDCCWRCIEYGDMKVAVCECGVCEDCEHGRECDVNNAESFEADDCEGCGLPDDGKCDCTIDLEYCTTCDEDVGSKNLRKCNCGGAVCKDCNYCEMCGNNLDAESFEAEEWDFGDDREALRKGDEHSDFNNAWRWIFKTKRREWPKWGQKFYDKYKWTLDDPHWNPQLDAESFGADGHYLRKSKYDDNGRWDISWEGDSRYRNYAITLKDNPNDIRIVVEYGDGEYSLAIPQPDIIKNFSTMNEVLEYLDNMGDVGRIGQPSIGVFAHRVSTNRSYPTVGDWGAESFNAEESFGAEDATRKLKKLMKGMSKGEKKRISKMVQIKGIENTLTELLENSEVLAAPASFADSGDEDDKKYGNDRDWKSITDCEICARPFSLNKFGQNLIQHFLKESKNGERRWKSKKNPDGTRRTARNLSGFFLYEYGLDALNQYVLFQDKTGVSNKVIELLRLSIVDRIIAGDVVNLIEMMEMQDEIDDTPMFGKGFEKEFETEDNI